MVYIFIQNGQTALMIAERRGHTRIVALLQRELIYRRRRGYLLFLAQYQFINPPPTGYPRESNVEKVLAIKDMQRYIATFL